MKFRVANNDFINYSFSPEYTYYNMNLVIDIGNTAIKFGLFENNALSKSFRVDSFRTPELKKAIKKAKRIIVSSVKDTDEGLHEMIPKGSDCLFFTTALKLPVTINYRTPKTLGADRLIGACAAVNLYPGKNILVIDAGTCITYDVVDKNKVYQGGSISPGLEMRYKSLREFTARLPHVPHRVFPEITGKSTEESILSGVQNGIIAEVEGMIERFAEEYPFPVVILTGGDANFFGGKLKSPIFAEPNLTLTGLNDILKINE
ncbi:MAG: type III pantothenate kinase [Bacteroidetes bacterium]|nr:type III pantothenate kinase [Bacteroidota bacterium]MBU1718388.1 type III pantothenate kinase [Bacteroidota bacterium]